MDKKLIVEAVKKLRKDPEKRNFAQSVDVVVNLKNLDIKKVENQVEFFLPLPHGVGKSVKICALVGGEMKDEAKVFDKVITQDEFQTIDKKAAKKLSEEYKFFIAQSNIMPKVAQTFGRTLGPRGKMPNPKAGCVVVPKSNLAALKDKLQKTIKVSAKTRPVVQVVIGHESMSDEQLIENLNILYDQLVHHLPQGENNVGTLYIKYTMGKTIKI